MREIKLGHVRGDKGRHFFAWNKDEELENISYIEGLRIDDAVVNTGKMPVRLLGVMAAIGDIVIVTSNETGKAAGNLRGPQGNPPQHEWNGTSLRFQNANGAWGAFTDLRGATGLQGIQGIQGPVGAPGRDGRDVTHLFGRPNGIATLDENGQVPLEKLPAGAGASFVYNCNGVNDNEILTRMSKDFYNAPLTGEGALNNNASLKIVVNGVVGITERPIAGTGAWSNDWRYFDFGIANYSGNRKLYIDWSNATIPQKIFNGGDNGVLIYNNGSFIGHEKANIKITLNFRFTGRGAAFYGDNTIISKGTVNISSESGISSMSGTGFMGNDNIYYDCRVTVATSAASRGYSGHNNKHFNCEVATTTTGSSTTAFGGNNNAYSYCKGVAMGVVRATGFHGNNNNHFNCTGIGKITVMTSSTSDNSGRGFSGRTNKYTNCNGMGIGLTASSHDTSTIRGDGFNGDESEYASCIGTGIAMGMGSRLGVGFHCHNAMLVNCDGIGLTADGRGASGYRTNNSAWDTYHIIQNCRFPIGAAQGFNVSSTNVEAINLGFSGTHVVSGCIISDQISPHNRIIGQLASEGSRFRSNNITSRPIRRQVQL
ncbi:MAG: hypothetical protein FWC80_00495 [Firmicutes bacterium]|nr:hypothetical protein [Bacillota bacterium]